MIKAYKVSEQLFCLEMQDGSPVWTQLVQYQPFENQNAEGSLFTLRVVDSLPECRTEFLYKSPRDPGEPIVDLYSTGDGRWYFETAPESSQPICAAAIAEHDFSSATLCIRNQAQALFAVNNSMMLMFAFATACRGVLEMHASVIEYKGRAYAFLGKSGAGKSTHSRQWLKAFPDSRLLNDDNPIVRVTPDGQVLISGSPWSGKTPCYINRTLPLGAFVSIRQAPVNRMTKLNILNAYAEVYSSCSGYRADRRMADGLHSTIEKVVLNLPCYQLECLPDQDAARVCAEAVCSDE